MPSWGELVTDFQKQPEPSRSNWLSDELVARLKRISALRNNRHVLFYTSAFLQKPAIPGNFIALMPEDINGIMAALHGMNWGRGLTLVLHTPGGDIGAAQTIAAYLHSKFEYIECIVPTFAMSAGTMIALGCDRIIMGRQSQLGPIDAQLNLGGRQISAGAVRAQFDSAKTEILGDQRAAHVWAPILQSLGPSLYQEALYALDYGQSMVTEWLAKRMFRGRSTAESDAKRVAQYFNATSNHKYHGRRIDREEARAQGVVVEDLEPNQDLQEAVLSAYHLATILIETSPTTKAIFTDTNHAWIKNYVAPR